MNAAREAQLAHYRDKLSYETDSWDLFELLQSSKAVVVVDGRSREAFAAEHIPGAVSLPHREICSETTSALPTDAICVCYCDGIGCNASTKTALKLLTLGFNVRELMGGLDWWKRDGYATAGEEGRQGKEMRCGC